MVYTQISIQKNPDGTVPFDQVRVGDWLLAETAGAHKSYEFDVDGDGSTDFGFYSTIDRTDTGTTASGVYAAPYAAVEILGSPYPPPWANEDALGVGLSPGSIIGADTPELFGPGSGVEWGGTGYLTGRFNLLSAVFSTGQSGTFYAGPGEESRFLAFRILKDDGWHYGWLEAGGGALGLTLYGIAWETEADKAIVAGLVPEPSAILFTACGAAALLSRRFRRA